MVAFNSHFDAAFLDHLFASEQQSWRDLYHYFILDLALHGLELGLRGLTGTVSPRHWGLRMSRMWRNYIPALRAQNSMLGSTAGY